MLRQKKYKTRNDNRSCKQWGLKRADITTRRNLSNRNYKRYTNGCLKRMDELGCRPKVNCPHQCLPDDFALSNLMPGEIKDLNLSTGGG